MLFRFTILTLLFAVLAVQLRNEVRIARNTYLARVHCDSTGRTQKAPPRRAFETRIVDIDRRELTRMLASPDILSQSRLVTAEADGGTRRVRIHAVRPGSLFETLGIASGDALLAINGKGPVGSPARALFQPAADLDFLDLELERAGRPLRIVVLIHG